MAQWCSKHAPPKPGRCSVHNAEWEELHDEEIRRVYGVEAVFYCPWQGCDRFDRDIRASTSQPMVDFVSKNGVHPGSYVLVDEVFTLAARQKILFHKQAQAVATE